MERNGVELHYAQTPKGWAVESHLDNDRQNALLTWIFGAGMLAFTPVGERDGVYFEHRVSWYSALHRPGMTLGHPSTKPPSAAAALGQPQTPQTIYRCFNCHATNVKPGPDLSAMQVGVQCERCHGPAAAHVKAPSRVNIRKNASVEACAECHRLPDEKALRKTAPEKADTMSIRFAPVGLMASNCYLASGALTCTTCHDPHGRPYPEKPEYEKKCQGCHAPAPLVSSQCPRAENTNCLACHMAKATPVPGLTFTDHRIRVYPAALKN
jgi:DNA-directed RNA polymerase subunit RPC12/RpoP